MHVENSVGLQAWPVTALLWRGCLGPRERTEMPGERRTGQELGTHNQPALCCPKAKTAAHPCYQRFDQSVFQMKVGAGLWRSEARAKGSRAPGRGNTTLFLGLPNLRELGGIN